MSAPGKPLTKLPKGILPEGISPPPGTDIMQFCRDLAESGADFAEQFDRNSTTYHNSIHTTAVPLGGERVPESMPDAMPGKEAATWREMPDAPLAIEEDFGPEYHHAMRAYKQFNECKKMISVVNKPVEMVMRLRFQYQASLSGPSNCVGEDRTAFESRLKGAENDRDGALAAATATLMGMEKRDLCDRTRACVQDVVDRGKFEFTDKETFGEYMQVLQRATQAIFSDQTKLLARIKAIKKAAKTTQVVDHSMKAPEVASEVHQVGDTAREAAMAARAAAGYAAAPMPAAPAAAKAPVVPVEGAAVAA